MICAALCATCRRNSSRCANLNVVFRVLSKHRLTKGLFHAAATTQIKICGVQEFVPVARELEGNWTTFTPHYIVWVCPDVYRASEECQQQCIHNGRYCTPDPDGDLMAGYSGKDVVQVPQVFA